MIIFSGVNTLPETELIIPNAVGWIGIIMVWLLHVLWE